MKPLENELKRISEILNRHGIDYMLIGGFAVSFHGFTRTTADIDFWFKPTNENYFKLLKVLEVLKFDIGELQQEVFHHENTFLRIPFDGIKIEFLSSIPGEVNYSEAVANAVDTNIGDIKIKVIGIDHLIKSKSALGRPIDKLDVEELKKRMNTNK